MVKTDEGYLFNIPVHLLKVVQGYNQNIIPWRRFVKAKMPHERFDMAVKFREGAVKNRSARKSYDTWNGNRTEIWSEYDIEFYFPLEELPEPKE